MDSPTPAPKTARRGRSGPQARPLRRRFPRSPPVHRPEGGLDPADEGAAPTEDDRRRDAGRRAAAGPPATIATKGAGGVAPAAATLARGRHRCTPRAGGQAGPGPAPRDAAPTTERRQHPQDKQPSAPGQRRQRPSARGPGHDAPTDRKNAAPRHGGPAGATPPAPFVAIVAGGPGCRASARVPSPVVLGRRGSLVRRMLSAFRRMDRRGTGEPAAKRARVLASLAASGGGAASEGENGTGRSPSLQEGVTTHYR